MKQNSLLTDSHRDYLRANVENVDGETTVRYRIRKRVRQGIHDFRILADELEERDLELIFDVEPGIEHYELSKDIAKAIEFMFVGLGGEGTFRGALKLGVANGEVELGNIESSFHAIPRFEIDRLQQTRTTQKIVEAVNSGQVDSLEAPDLYTFIKQALDADAIDFEQISEVVEFDERVVPPLDHQPELEEMLDEGAETMETLRKALEIGLAELADRGELPNQE